MNIAADPAIINTIWQALNQAEPVRTYPQKVQAWSEEIAATGWAYSWDIQDLPTFMDGRLDLISDVKFKDLARILGLPVRYIHKKPDPGAEASTGFPAMAATDFAVILITLERIGFMMDPSPLVRLLRPGLVARSHLTAQELQVMDYEAYRHRMVPVFLHHTPNRSFNGLRETTIKTTGGYHARLHADNDGEPLSLTVKAPKFRRARESAF